MKNPDPPGQKCTCTSGLVSRTQCASVTPMTNGSTHVRFTLFAAGILGLTGVALGAVGAHALKSTLVERGMTQAWESAARYHLFHALALLGAAAWSRSAPESAASKALFRAAQLWSFGVLLFSGSLYWLALGGPGFLGPITPLGGLAFLAGWALVAWSAFHRSE